MRYLAFELGIRNVMRNRRRSIITASVIGFCLFVLMTAHSFMDGFTDFMIRRAVGDFYGQAHYRHAAFIATQQQQYFVGDAQSIATRLAQDRQVRVWTPRILATAMLASPQTTVNVQAIGVDRVREPQFSKLARAITDGNFLSAPYGQVLLGFKTASRLQLAVGDKLIITTTTAQGGRLVQELLRVQGIFRMDDRSLDEGAAIISLEQGQALLEIGAGVHEIAVQYDTLQPAPEFYEARRSELMDPNLRYQSWPQFIIGLEAILSFSYRSLSIVVIILGILVALTVANTMSMSLLERMVEFGVLRALGTRPALLRRMVLAEACGLSGFAALIALALWMTLGMYLSRVGVDYSGMSYMNISLNEPMRFRYSLPLSLAYSVGTFVFVTLLSLLPTQRMLRRLPAIALRERS